MCGKGRAISDGLVVEVVECAAQAFVEEGTSSNSEGIVAAYGETVGVEGVVLDVTIVLELVVGDDGSGTQALVGQDTTFKGGDGG